MIRSLLLLICAMSLGCGKSFLTDPKIGSELPFFKESHSNEFIPESDRLIGNCQKDGEICVFLKNPIFQEKRLLAPDDLLSLKNAQRFSVRLTNLDLSGFVKNSNFDILSVDGDQRLKISDALTQKGVDENLTQAHFLNSFYWLNRAHEYLKKRFKDYPSAHSQIKVYVDDGFDGFNYSTKTLSLDLKKRSALSGEIALLLLGEAQVGYATKGAIYSFSEASHALCDNDPRGCCKTQDGCANAILRGSGDIFLGMLFEGGGVGEFYFQDLHGQKVCGLSRDPSSFKNIRFSEAHTLCAHKPGHSLALGMVYASIWSEVREQFNSQDVDRVFLKHLEKLTGSDDFNSAFRKIQETCVELGLNELSLVFANEFSRRR